MNAFDAPVVPSVPRARRVHCLRCGLPARTCLCARAVPVAQATRVLILQHPAEAGHAKGTARLLQLSLRAARLEVGEVFDPAQLRDWIGPGPAVLLYPEEAGPSRPTVPAAPAAPAGAVRCLVVLDGTWRQSRRLLQANPVLHGLPRFALADTPASRYAVRRAHRPGQLSTLEATVLALQRLEGPSTALQALLRSFDAHVADLAARAGPCTSREVAGPPDVTSGPARA